MTVQDIENIFTFHASSTGQIERYAAIRSRARDAALEINSSCPESREKSLAITSLQQAVMWANAAIAIHGDETSE